MRIYSSKGIHLPCCFVFIEQYIEEGQLKISITLSVIYLISIFEGAVVIIDI